MLSELTTDADAPLFRFMLISQHDLLPRLSREQRTAVDAVADTVASGPPKLASTTGIKGSAAVIAAVRPAR